MTNYWSAKYKGVIPVMEIAQFYVELNNAGAIGSVRELKRKIRNLTNSHEVLRQQRDKAQTALAHFRASISRVTK